MIYTLLPLIAAGLTVLPAYATPEPSDISPEAMCAIVSFELDEAVANGIISPSEAQEILLNCTTST